MDGGYSITDSGHRSSCGQKLDPKMRWGAERELKLSLDGWQMFENCSNIDRKLMEHRSKIHRKSIENLSNIYRKSMENLSKIYAGMSVLACKLNSAGCFLGCVCGSLSNVR